MSATPDPLLARIEANPKYALLKRKRNALGIVLTIAMLVAYYGFIGAIAFDKEFLARPLGAGVTSIGIPIAWGLIIFTVAITAFYVWRANREYDQLVDDVLREARS